MSEADLYDPIKRFLEQQGYTVKGEVGACDIVAVRADEPPVVVELKLQLNLTLLLQAVDRLKLSDTVYLAFRIGEKHSATFRSHQKQVLALMRRLGLGLLTVSARDVVTAVLDPAPYRPRVDKPRRARLLKEFAERVGDPETGGSAPKQRLTSYRQDALRCARELGSSGVLKLSELRARTAVTRAGAIVRDNHYGWFERAAVGHYGLTPKGRVALEQWGEALRVLPAPPRRDADAAG
ncbi:MAG: hypothetical protein H6835_11320 [Planctomycetes bacterium]|nr:hypothetical protein [Planctomycetota bacterium]